MHGLLLLLLIVMAYVGLQKGPVTRTQIGVLITLIIVIAIGRGD